LPSVILQGKVEEISSKQILGRVRRPKTLARWADWRKKRARKK